MDNELKRKAEQWIDEHMVEYIEVLKSIIDIKSISNEKSDIKPYGKGCREVLDSILTVGAGYGYRTENFAYRLGAVTLDNDSDKSIGIWSHLDVVPAGDHWEHDPFNATVENDILYGRGAGDNKGPAVGALFAIRCLDELQVKLNHSVKLFFGCDEECGMSDIVWFTGRYKQPDLNLIPDAAFPVSYGEKGILQADFISGSDLSDDIIAIGGGLVSNVVPDHAWAELSKNPVIMEKLKGIGPEFEIDYLPESIKIHTYGKAKHAAEPYLGINAVYLLTRILSESGLLSPEDSDIFKFPTILNQDFIGTGLGIKCSDDVSGNLTCVGSMIKLEGRKPVISINCRYPIKENGDRIISAASETSGANGYIMRNITDNKPSYFPKESPIVKKLTDIYNVITGCSSEPFTMGGGTYARKLKNAIAYGFEGMPVPEGTPFIGEAHEHDEGIYLPGIKKAILIYIMTLAEADKLL